MKKDIGFEICYWNLSYRRKFIRTLWITPFAISVSLLVWHVYHSKILTVGYLIIITVIGVIQAIYVYRKWKNELPERANC
ncbi:hypothetical protein [Aminipila terrae]|uniref:Uncharacterized protein n=1 Tax=Aminipila terrae TaxID=2697030 RepID=A0A6P1MP82_9FIRM|nr:hypothetical protein [Aminipila terrae]QHI73486.1 hypothetical protein Ami3637_14855 [Aminipila terrae]